MLLKWILIVSLLLNQVYLVLAHNDIDTDDIQVRLQDYFASLERGGSNDYYQPRGVLNDFIDDIRESPQSKMSPQLLQTLKFILRYVPLQNSPFEDYLKGQEEDWSQVRDLSLESLLRDYVDSHNLDDILGDCLFWNLLPRTSQTEESHPDTFTNDTDPGEEAYAMCRNDLHRMFKPFTNMVLRLIINFICDSDIIPPIVTCSNYVRGVDGPTLLPGSFPLIDSYSKLPAGIAQGMLSWVGSYDQCNEWDGTSFNLTNDEDEITDIHHFGGKYCRIGLNCLNENNNCSVLLNLLKFGFCMADTCSEENVTYFLSNELGADLECRVSLLPARWEKKTIPLMSLLGLETNAFCGHEMKMNEDSRAQVSIAVILIFLSIAIIATVYDVLIRRFVYSKYFHAEEEGTPLADIPSVTDVVNMYVKDQTPEYETVIANSIPNGKSDGPNSLDLNGKVHFSVGPPSPAEGTRKLQSQLSYISTASSSAELLKRQLSVFSVSPVWDTVDQEVPSECNPLFLHGVVAGLVESISAGVLTWNPSCWIIVPDYSPLERCEVALLGFSLYSNLRRVCRVEGASAPLDALNGIRFLTLAWTVLGYSFLLGNVYTEAWTTANILPALQDYLKRWTFQPVVNFHFSADTMFVISGFLITYNWIRQAKRNGGRVTPFMVVYHYIHYYWKLMPVLMITLMVYTTMYYFLSEGPLNPPEVSDAENCRDNWWTNLLLVHNLVKTDTQCFAWTWFSATIFQLHLIIPLVLIPLIYFPVIGYISLAILYIVHIIVLSVIAAGYYDDFDFSDWYRDILTAPWCRAGAYFIGVAVAFILRKTTFKFKMPWVATLFGWACALVCILAPSYGTYSMFEDGGIDIWDKSDLVAWEVLGRTSWALGVSWMIFACATGNGGVINSLLSWRAFVPLSKLCYCWYIVHPVLIFKYAYSSRQPLYVNDGEMTYRYLGHLAYSAMFAILLLLLFQYPLRGVERAFLVKTKMDVLRAGWLPAPKRVEAYEDLDWQKKQEVRTWDATKEQNLENDGSEVSKL